MTGQKQMQKQEINILKIADEIEKEGSLEMYWNYDDKLTDEQAIKIITEEEGLMDIENEVYEYNTDYLFEMITERINDYLEEKDLNLTEEEKDDLRFECESRFDYNINGLLNNSEINIRVTLQSNEDMICFVDDVYKESETIKEFKRVFRRKYKKEDLDNEINEMVNDNGLFTFYFKVSGKDILELREQVLNGYIELRKGLPFGFFNSFIGGGSVLEMELLSNIKLNLKDWRFKNTKEEIIANLKDKTDYGYYPISIQADEISKYGIQETYGLSSWEEY